MEEMKELILSDNFMPHGYCFLWRPELVWMHAITDIIIALSYFTIPLAIIFLVKKSKSHLPFPWIFMMFATFIFLCGLTHLIELVGIWKSYYYLEGAVKILTAAVSLATAIMMFPLVPALVQKFQDLEEFIKSKKKS